MPVYDKAVVNKALALLAANGGNYKKTARETGISRWTLRTWRTGGQIAVPKGNTPVAENKRKLLGQRLRRVENIYLKHLEKPEIVAKTAARDSAITLGILHDKADRAEGLFDSEGATLTVKYMVPGSLKALAASVLEGNVLPIIQGEVKKPVSSVDS